MSTRGPSPPRRRAESGYAVLAVLFLGVAAFLALAVAVQANYHWHRWNKDFQKELKERALETAAIQTEVSTHTQEEGSKP